MQSKVLSRTISDRTSVSAPSSIPFVAATSAVDAVRAQCSDGGQRSEKRPFCQLDARDVNEACGEIETRTPTEVESTHCIP